VLLRNIFSNIPSKTADEIRALIETAGRPDYKILDVRQPSEYQSGHIPGAMLIPLPELTHKWRELDPEKPTTAYCRAGNRSLAAAMILLSAGFKDVFNMDGGMNAWKGLKATGGPEAGMSVISPDTDLESMVAAAWAMEKGTGAFYSKVAEGSGEGPAASLFRELVVAEKGHASSLLGVYNQIARDPGEDSITAKAADITGGSAYMEGGILLDEATNWATGKNPEDLLEFSMSMETNSYDLYLKITQRVEDDLSAEIFKSLADEEWKHLGKIGEFLDEFYGDKKRASGQ